MNILPRLKVEFTKSLSDRQVRILFKIMKLEAEINELEAKKSKTLGSIYWKSSHGEDVKKANLKIFNINKDIKETKRIYNDCIETAYRMIPGLEERLKPSVKKV